MNTQSAQMDVESLQKSERRRGGCVTAFLVVSVIFLFAAVTALAVVGVMAVKDLQSRLGPRFSSEPHAQKSPLVTPGTAYTNFAYVEATSSRLGNSTMKWAVVKHGDGESVGSNFKFDRDNHILTPMQQGNYFMYISLNFTCTYRCDAGVLTVHVGEKLTCNVHLPKHANSTPVSRKCWTVSRVGAGENLLAQMTVPKDGVKDWRLELNTSGFGMFLVD